MEEQVKEKHETLRIQLQQLNERSRWYSGRLWQEPFAFLAIIAFATSTIFKIFDRIHVCNTILGSIFLIAFFVGLAVLWHMGWLAEGERRAVQNLKNIEKELGLEPTVEYRGHIIWSPLSFVILIVTLIFLFFGIDLRC